MKLFSYFVILLAVFLGVNAAYASHPVKLCPVFTRSLAYGSRGEDVSALQQYLASETNIYPEGLVTGYFGKLTEAAVKRFQAKNGVVSSGSPATTGYGIFGPKTRAKLKELCEKMNFDHGIIPVETMPVPVPVPIPESIPNQLPEIPLAQPATTTISTASSSPTSLSASEQASPAIIIGSYNGTECTLEVEPKIAVLGRDRPEATWKITTNPSGWHFYWHSITNGKDEGDVYGGITNKSRLEEYPAEVAKYGRYAHVVIEQNHIIDTNHSNAVCTTNTATFEIKGSY